MIILQQNMIRNKRRKASEFSTATFESNSSFSFFFSFSFFTSCSQSKHLLQKPHFDSISFRTTVSLGGEFSLFPIFNGSIFELVKRLRIRRKHRIFLALIARCNKGFGSHLVLTKYSAVTNLCK